MGFNHGQMKVTLQETLHSCIQYTLCSDPNSFSLTMLNAAAKLDTDCVTDYVGIAGKPQVFFLTVSLLSFITFFLSTFYTFPFAIFQFGSIFHFLIWLFPFTNWKILYFFNWNVFLSSHFSIWNIVFVFSWYIWKLVIRLRSWNGMQFLLVLYVLFIRLKTND